VLLAIPLLVGYEALASFLSAGQDAQLRNGADVLMQEFFLMVAGQRYASLLFAISMIGLGLWVVGRDMRANRGGLRPRVFVGMLLEAVVLAVCFGTVVGSLSAHVVGAIRLGSAADAITWLVGPGGRAADAMPMGPIARAPTATKIMLALGAGVYEELVFRVFLVSAIALVTRRVFKWSVTVSGLVAVGLSALIFATFHYIGPYGDPLRLDSFVFRLIGGVVFSALYVTRGFGITAWTHALYDLMAFMV
jgi:Na+-translocating ferredoxin:NAD+ oxidoreductase RnfD subunit